MLAGFILFSTLGVWALPVEWLDAGAEVDCKTSIVTVYGGGHVLFWTVGYKAILLVDKMQLVCVCVSMHIRIVQTVFQHIGKALASLITLDHMFTVGGSFHEHWNQYKRYTIALWMSYYKTVKQEVTVQPFASSIADWKNGQVCSLLRLMAWLLFVALYI